MSSNEIVIHGKELSKAYRLYAQPQDRLKHALLWRFGREYGHVFWALKDISLELHRGEMLGIIGRNGSGKSTLLQILASTLTPTEGEIHVDGRVAALLELGSGFNPEFTGRENIYLNASIIGLSPDETEYHLENIITFADIGDFIDQPVKLYSSGMFIRLAFAVTTGLDPDVLLVDEALAVGDVFFKQKCYQRLDEMRQQGVAVVLVTHNMMDVEQFCDRVILLQRGEGIFEGTASQAVKQYYILEQEERLASLEVSVHKSVDKKAQSLKTEDSEVLNTSDKNVYFWPASKVFKPITDDSQITNGGARCLGVALCDSNGEPRQVFQQGESATFFYEFELLEDFRIPIGGIMLKNQYGMLIHGKNSLQFDMELPRSVPAATRIRFKQEIVLDIASGEYTFEVGLAEITPDIYEKRSFLHPSVLRQGLLRVCNLPEVGSFVVAPRKEGQPMVLTHYGACNLPGSQQLFHVGYTSETESTKITLSNSNKPSGLHDRSSFKENGSDNQKGNSTNLPTLIHVTHWKAGSQWIRKILQECMPENIIIPEVGSRHFIGAKILDGYIYPAVYVTRQQFYEANLPEDWVRFVVIRDLRDTLVSAYFSLRYSHSRVSEFIDKTRSILSKLDLEDGMIYLMRDWLPASAEIQKSWIEAGENVIHFEDLISEDSCEFFKKVLLKEARFPVSAKHICEILDTNRFENLAGRKPGNEDVTHHMRKGIVGDWRNYFTPRIKDEFRKHYSDLLITSGYERNSNW